MHSFFSDVRYAVRLWGRNPGFTAAAVLTLALGIGANTTMFSVVNATLLRPLPFPDADRLMTVWQGRTDDPENTNIVSLPNFRDWQARSQSFENLALFDSAGRGYNLTGAGEAEQVLGLRVTASFFPVLGIPPMLGRTFLPEEEAPGHDVVVLSHGLWTRRYDADPTIVNKTIQIDSRAFTVVGVMPADFHFQFWGQRQLWVPAGWTAGDQGRDSNSFIAIGRLRPDVDLARARSEMDTIRRALAQAFPKENANGTVRLVALREYGMQSVRPALFALLAVVGFVLLIACVNVANLMLARTAARTREMAIRCALGAGRRRIVGQLLTESVVLAVVGGLSGLLLAYVSTALLVPILPGNLTSLPMRPLTRIDIDYAVLGFTLVASLVSGVLFGLVPAISAFRRDLNQSLKENARGSAGGPKSRLRYGLVAVEVGLTLVVMAGAGVMIVSLSRLLGVDPGLDPKNVLVMPMSVPQENLYYGPPGNPRFCENLDRQVGSVPGVVSVSAIAHLPLSGAGAGRGIAIEGRPDPGPGDRPGAGYSVACPNLLRTMGIRLVAGRDFTLRDTLESPGVVVVNESFARRFWPGEEAVGKRFKIGRFDSDVPWVTVVGVFADIRFSGLANDVRPLFFRPYQQAGWPVLSIVTKTASAPSAYIAGVKRALAIIEPSQPVSRVRTMEDVIGTSVSSRRFPMLLLSVFAVLALVLAAVGIAGVVGYSVVQRTQEIGLRMALGAQAGDVLQLVVRHSLWWTLAGVGVGLVVSFVLLGFLQTLVYGVTPTDPLVLGVVSLVLVTVALIAAVVPARRAMRVDPVSVLRNG